MKKKTKIMLIILLILILTIHISFKLSGRAFASSEGETDVFDTVEGFIGGAIDGLLGLFLLLPKFGLLILGGILGLIMGYFAADSSVVGLIESGGLTLQKILFNKVNLLDINYFNFGDSDSTATIIKQNVAIWYTSIRNIAIIVLAIIAVYVGIRMALSTIAEEKAKYKTMLIDWLTSLALVFLLHYIMIFTISINNAFVDALSKGLPEDSSDMGDKFLTTAIKSLSAITGMASALIYLILQGITFIFLLTYIKRFITIGFLIVIAPLVTITYSIDKMGDGKSQALNVWLKEFVYNILIQPFHCISYLVLGTTAIQLMTTDADILGGVDLTQAVLAIAILIFIYSTEKIVKHIFHFESESMADVVAGAAIAGTVLSTTMNGMKKAKAGGGAIKNFANNDGTQKQDTTSKQPKQQTQTVPETKTDQNQITQNTKPTRVRPQVQTTSTTQTNKKKPGKMLKGAIRTSLNVGDRVFGTLAFGGLALSTGNPTAMITSGVAGYNWGAERAEKRNLKNRQTEMAKAVQSYRAVAGNENLSLNDLTNNALEFADGTRIAQTDEEKALKYAMQKLQIQYSKQGLDEKKIIKQSSQVIKDIENGFITPVTSVERFFGNIKQTLDNQKKENNETRYRARKNRETKDGKYIFHAGDNPSSDQN